MTKDDLRKHPTKLLTFAINGKRGKGVINDNADGFDLVEIGHPAPNATATGATTRLTDEMVEAITEDKGSLELRYDNSK